MYLRNGGGSLSPGRSPLARPESEAMSRLSTSAAPADSARRLARAGASAHAAGIRKRILRRLRAHLSAPGPCPAGRLQVGRAGPTGASPHAQPPHRSPSPHLLCDGDLHGRAKGPWRQGVAGDSASVRAASPRRPGVLAASRSGPRASCSSRRCGPAARLYLKVTLLYHPPFLSTKLK